MMFKKLFAPVLAALLLLSPMTAFAVSWDEIETALIAGGSFSGNGIEAKREGNAVAVSGDGRIEEFRCSEAFDAYTFSGRLRLGGERFTVDVGDGASGVRRVEVNIGSGVTVCAEGVDVSVSGGQQLTLVCSGAIETGDAVRLGAYDSASLILVNDGTVDDELVADACGQAAVDVTNNGRMDELMASANDSGTMNVTNNGRMDELNAASMDSGTTNVRNEGVVEELSAWAMGGGTTNVTNNGRVEELYRAADGEGRLHVTNNSTVLKEEAED